jgi:hypothetical protein
VGEIWHLETQGNKRKNSSFPLLIDPICEFNQILPKFHGFRIASIGLPSRCPPARPVAVCCRALGRPFCALSGGPHSSWKGRPERWRGGRKVLRARVRSNGFGLRDYLVMAYLIGRPSTGGGIRNHDPSLMNALCEAAENSVKSSAICSRVAHSCLPPPWEPSCRRRPGPWAASGTPRWPSCPPTAPGRR